MIGGCEGLSIYESLICERRIGEKLTAGRQDKTRHREELNNHLSHLNSGKCHRCDFSFENLDVEINIDRGTLDAQPPVTFNRELTRTQPGRRDYELDILLTRSLSMCCGQAVQPR